MGFLCTALLISIMTLNGAISSQSFLNTFTQDLSTSSFEVSYTFKRQNYDPLPYFNKDYSTPYLKYAILNDYAAVIEPSATMEFYLYEDSSYTYNYSICQQSLKQKGSEQCRSGSYSKDSTENNQVEFDCQPYDTFAISVDIFDASGSLLANEEKQGDFKLFFYDFFVNYFKAIIFFK
jgi:hypothetical protein